MPARARLHELDAIRGLAAVSVMLGHSTIAFPAFDGAQRGDGLTLVNLLEFTPLNLAIAGAAAVIVFFVLSGFVLTLPFLGRDDRDGYGAFLTRRVCRIWIPYIAAVALAMVVASLFIGETDPDLSGWFNAAWQQRPGAGAIGSHVLLIGNFHNGAYDPVLWSLVHEMRISLVFPLLVSAVLWLGPQRALAAGVAVLTVSYAAGRVVLENTDYLATGEYLVCFVVGILLATHRLEVRARLEAARPRVRAGLWVVAVLGLSWRGIAPDIGPARLTITDVAMNTIGAAAAISLAQGGAAKRFLLGTVPQFLGRISYSLYLVHAIVLLAALHIAGATAAVLPVVWLMSIALADLGQRFVERPAQRLGRRLSARRPAPVAA